MKKASVAPTPSATHILRRTIRPYGVGEMVVTLSLWDSGIPCPDVDPMQRGSHNWIVYRLYTHAPRAKATVLFEGTDLMPRPDPDDMAVEIVDRLTRLPGDDGGPEPGDLSPVQMEWLHHHGRAVRAVAVERLGWSIPTTSQLRMGLDVIYQKRADARATLRHQYTAGVVSIAARTKGDAKTAFGVAIGTQLSSLPVIKVGAVSREVYVLYPHGTEWVIQVVDPTRPQAPLGESVRFAASSPTDATDVMVGTMGRRERTRPVTVPAPQMPQVPPPSGSMAPIGSIHAPAPRAPRARARRAPATLSIRVPQ